MDPIDYAAFFEGSDGDAKAQAKALADAIRSRRDMGALGTILGGPFAHAGQQLGAEAQGMDRALQGAQQFHAQGAQLKRALLQRGDQFQQSQALRERQMAQSAAQAAERLALQRQQIGQDAWAVVPDQSGGGGGYKFNRKTGQVEALQPPNPQGPGGLRVPAFKTEDQSKSFSFTERMREARRQMTEAGYPEGIPGRKDAAAMGAQSGPISSLIPQEAASEPGSRYFNAARNLVAALLRKESGAAISNDEWKQFTGLYIPMPWDSPEAKANKLRLLDIMEKSMAAASGPSANRYWEQSGSIQTPPQGTTGGPVSSMDAQAKAWADANPDDPRAAKILQRLGAGR